MRERESAGVRERDRPLLTYFHSCWLLQSGSLYAVHVLVNCGADTIAVDENGRNGLLLATLVGAV